MSDVREMSRKRIEEEPQGPFNAIFNNPIAKVLDQSMIVGNMEQTASMLAESTELDYKTVKSVLDHLINLKFVQKTRKIGNAQAYRFDVENDLHELLKCGLNFQNKRNR